MSSSQQDHAVCMHTLTLIGVQNHDERSHYNISVELDDVEILRTTQILGVGKIVFSTKCDATGKDTSIVRFKLYKVIDDEVDTTSLEGEVQCSLAELKSAHGIEQDDGFSIVLPPSSVSLSVRLMPSQNEERSDAGAGCLTPSADNNSGTGLQNMDWGSLSDRANSLMSSCDKTHRGEDIEESIRILSAWYSGLPSGSENRAACANSIGLAFYMRLQHSNSIDDLERAVHYWSIALESWTPGSPYYVPLVVNLGGMLRRKFEWQGKFEDVEQAIMLYSAATSSCPPDSPYRHNLLNNYALAVLSRFEQTGDPQDLDLSIQTHQECLLLRPPGHSSRFSTLSNLADAIRVRYRHRGNVDDLTSAMTYYHGALEFCSAENPSYPMILMNVGLTLRYSFEHNGNLQSLNTAIKYYSDALTTCPDNHPTRSSLLANYAGDLYVRFTQSGDINDLEYSIELYTNSLADQSPTHVYRFSSLHGLAITLMSRFKAYGIPEDLDLAITHIASSMALCGPSHPEHISVIMVWTNCLIMRYETRGDITDLDAAVEHSEAAIHFCPSKSPDYIPLLTHVNNVLSTRFSRRQDVRDLERIIEYCDSALRDVPHHHISNRVFAMDRADALLQRHFQEGDLNALEHIISFYREIMQDLSRGHQAFPRALIQLASALQARFEQSGSADDLNCAVNHYRTACEACPPGHDHHSTAFSGLGNALLLRYQIFGPLGDLDECLVHLAHVVEARALTTHPDYPKNLANFAYAIFVRFQNQHDIADLDIAVNYLQVARDHPNQSEGRHILTHLATALSARYDEREDIDDLQECIKLFETALPMFAPDNPQALHLRRNLAHSLQKMYAKRQTIEDLNAAIAHFEAYMMISPEDHPDLPLTLIYLASCRHMRAKACKNDDDFGSALSLLATASEKLPEASPFFFPVYHLYTTIFGDYYRLTEDDLYLKKAFQYHQLASNAPGIHTWNHLTAALRWRTDANVFHHTSALEAYKTSIKLLDRHVMATPTVSGRYKALLGGILRDTPSLAADATACAISAGDLELAVELSEQGRGLLWSQMSRFRATINDLQAVDDEGRRLADEFEFLSAELGRRQSDDSSGIKTVTETLRRTQQEEGARQYRQVSSQWDAVVSKIRQKQGFAYFLTPMPYNELRAAAIAGPVVIINASIKRCDAIIITKIGPPRLVPLLDASLMGIATLSDDFRNVLRNTAGVGEEKMREKQLIPVFRRLWDAALAPVVEVLLTIVPKGSRVWWCPTSKLTSLPIHAAGPYRKGASNMPNVYVSSYTPTLSALIRSRRQTSSKVAPNIPSLVAIGQSKPNSRSGERELEAVGAELELVKSLVPPSMPCSDVSGDEGTVSGAIQALKINSWVHLACHGKQDLAQPFDSSFALRDKPLRLSDIIQAEPENPEFAFLSACHTAVGDKNAPDEVIHLAAGMQFSGFRGVIGTMWAVDDTTAHLMVKEFYSAMFSGKIDCTNAARALNKASKAVDKDKVPMDQRVVFIHIGA